MTVIDDQGGLGYRPRLRPHLKLTDDGVLVDPIEGRDIQLSPIGRALAAALDGQHELGALVDGLVFAGAPRDEVATGFRWLLLIHAIEGAGDSIVAQVDRVARGQEALPIALLDGARFECQGSGACCQNYVFGPLDDEDVARLEALDLAGVFPRLPPPYVEVNERGMRYLRSVDQRCIFLGEDMRCGIHAHFGGEHKPRICQLYPLEPYATIAGLRIVDKGSCKSFATAVRRGLPLADDMERVRQLLFRGRYELFHPVCTIDGIPCDFGIILEYAKAAMALVRHGAGTPPTLLAAVGAGLDRLRTALQTCPLEPGQPDAVVAQILVEPLAWTAPEEPEPARAGAAVFAELITALAAALAEDRSGSGDRWQPLERDGLRHLRLVAMAAEAAASGAALPALPIEDPEVDPILRMSLRQQLFGQMVLVKQHAAAGILRMAVVLTMAIWGARLRAGDAGKSAAGAADLSHGHWLALRIIDRRACQEVLLAREASWRQVLAGLPLVCDYRGDGRRPMP